MQEMALAEEAATQVVKSAGKVRLDDEGGAFLS